MKKKKDKNPEVAVIKKAIKNYENGCEKLTVEQPRGFCIEEKESLGRPRSSRFAIEEVKEGKTKITGSSKNPPPPKK